MKLTGKFKPSRFKYHYEIVLGKMLQPESKGSDYIEQQYLRAANVKEGSIDLSDIKTMWFSPHELRKYSLKPGDLIVLEGGDVGRCALWLENKSNIGFQNSVHRVRPLTGNCNEFARYWLCHLKSSGYFELICSKATFAHFTAEKFKEIPFPSIDFELQKSITAFLNYETTRIDQLINIKKQFLLVLEERRQAAIWHSVTKGINKNDQLEDRGVDWLGPLPTTWNVLKTKYIFRLGCKPAPENNDLELLSVYAEIGVRPRKELEERGNKASTTDGYWIVKKGDIVVNKLLAWMGAVGYSDYEGVTSPAYDILRPNKNTESKYYHYLFRTPMARKEFKRWSYGIMDVRLRLYFDKLGNIPMPVPPYDEQREIVKHIEGLESKYGQLSEKTQASIDRLNELRSALITAAVTGQINVTAWRRQGHIGRQLEAIEAELSA